MENEKEGFPITALREIRILQLLRHENIVNLVRRRLCKAFTRFMFQYLNKQITFPFIRHLLTRKIRETFFLLFYFSRSKSAERKQRNTTSISPSSTSSLISVNTILPDFSRTSASSFPLAK